MDLNHINLSAALIEELYKTTLIEGDDTKALPVKKTIAAKTTVEKGLPEKTIQYLGKNQQKICLLVNYPNEVYLPDTELDFLTNILLACKLNLGDVAIVNHQQYALSFRELQTQVGCTFLLLFGVLPGTLGLPELPAFTIGIQNGCQWVCSPATEELNSHRPDSKSLKGKLWASLKQLFGI